MNKYQKCIQTVLNQYGENVIDSEQATQILNAFDQRVKGYKGNTDDAVFELANELVGKEMVYAAKTKLKAISQVAANKRTMDLVEKIRPINRNLGTVLEAILVGNKSHRRSIDVQTIASEQFLLSRLEQPLKKAGLLENYIKGDLDKDIAYEIERIDYPDRVSSGNSEAEYVAKLVYSLNKETNKELAKAGIFINEIEGWINVSHDRETMINEGIEAFKEKVRLDPNYKGTAREESYNIWRSHIDDLIDKEQFARTSEDMEEALKAIHEGIYTGVHGSLEPLTMANAYNTGFKRRGFAYMEDLKKVFFLKRDGQSWNKYNARYGQKSMSASFAINLQKKNKLLNLAKTFGPDIETGYKRLVNELEHIAKDLPDSDKQLKAINNPLNKSYYDYVTGQLENPASNSIAKIGRGIRALQTITHLGGVLLTAQMDRPLYVREASFNGIKTLDSVFNNLTSYVKKDSSGEVGNSIKMIGASELFKTTHIANRFVHEGDSRFSKFVDTYMKWTGLSWHDESMKYSFVGMLSSHLGNNASKSFDTLPKELKNVFRLYEIESKDWDIARKSAWTPEKNDTYPDNLKLITPDNIADKNVQLKFQTYISDRASHAVLTPSGRERVLTSMGQRSGTLAGELARTITQFKQFPVTLLTKALSRDLSKHGAVKIAALSTANFKGYAEILGLASQMTIAGFIVGGIKDILKGREPKSLFKDGELNINVFYEAALKGGGLGILGDLILTEYDRHYKNPLSTLSGPALGDLSELGIMMSKSLRGELTGKDVYRFGKANTPFINLVYTKPVLDYLFFNSLEEYFSPGYWNNVERAIQNRQGQSFNENAGFLNPENRSRIVEENLP